jgi:DNA polymerase III alpha subunit
MLTNEEKLSKAVLKHGPDIIKFSGIPPEDITRYIDRIEVENLHYPIPKDVIDTKNWLIPKEYKELDIEKFLVEQCPEQNYDRLIKEIKLYQKHDMVIVLKAMKFLVDTFRKNNIVWGVGRGSSVASYALYLIGVHKIDSVKYNLPIEEFFKGERNG